ncbi:hypothetical protein P280DRAFT_308476 [Massarina eburnea CBS 473.64]|uniref:Uncharacterized protein n=1 Tax=Massarina eburnea CBS 473.64 TaxID=1395130 RepID=A0A6A6S1V4_9PLEO|nr:hypothetical protein P280DRAFT_308476 [Massarina eburnea CBS 473.64]
MREIWKTSARLSSVRKGRRIFSTESTLPRFARAGWFPLGCPMRHGQSSEVNPGFCRDAARVTADMLGTAVQRVVG